MSQDHWLAIAPPDLVSALERELLWRKCQGHKFGESTFLLRGDPVPLVWSQVVWPHVEVISINSIGQAASILRTQGKFWTHHSVECHRRGELIVEQAKRLHQKKIEFPALPPRKKHGAFCLLNENEMIFTKEEDRAGVQGILNFAESKESPSRAYLKLWEVFTRIERFPKPRTICLDLGSCPGGWTWVLALLEAEVISIDGAPLAPAVAGLPNVKFLKKDAFTLNPKDFSQVEWFFSDMICYPEKLLELVKVWLAEGQAKNFICTLKFQGEADFQLISEFEKLGQVIHLGNNKHELTWIRLAK